MQKLAKMYGIGLDEEVFRFGSRADHFKINNWLRTVLEFSVKKLEKIIEEKKKDQENVLKEKEIYQQKLSIREANPSNLFDFIIFSLKQHLSLQNEEQVVALLAEKNKYLSKIIILGLKQEFAQIKAWLRHLSENWGQVCDFLSQDDSNLIQLLELIKPCLLSKDPAVCEAGIGLYQRLVTTEYKAAFAEWFVQNQLLQLFMSCFRKYTGLQPLVTQFLPFVGERVLLSIDQ